MFSEPDSAAYCRGNQGYLTGLKAPVSTANAGYVEGRGKKTRDEKTARKLGECDAVGKIEQSQDRVEHLRAHR